MILLLITVSTNWSRNKNKFTDKVLFRSSYSNLNKQQNRNQVFWLIEDVSLHTRTFVNYFSLQDFKICKTSNNNVFTTYQRQYISIYLSLKRPDRFRGPPSFLCNRLSILGRLKWPKLEITTHFRVGQEYESVDLHVCFAYIPSRRAQRYLYHQCWWFVLNRANVQWHRVFFFYQLIHKRFALKRAPICFDLTFRHRASSI